MDPFPRLTEPGSNSRTSSQPVNYRSWRFPISDLALSTEVCVYACLFMSGKGWEDGVSVRVGKQRAALSVNYLKIITKTPPTLYPISLALFNQWHPAELSIWRGKIINRAERKREAKVSASIVVGTD